MVVVPADNGGKVALFLVEASTPGIRTEPLITTSGQPEARIELDDVRIPSDAVLGDPAKGALVLECTNMPPYAADIQRASGLPVFDIVSLVTLAHGALAAGLPPRPA